MWEDLKVYKQLDKKEINPTFKKFGNAILAALENYEINQTSSLIKLSRQTNEIEQSIIIQKGAGSYQLKVHICIKPIDFNNRHKFTMVNIVPLGDIMNNYRRTSYPLTREWNDLAVFLTAKIKSEIEQHFQKYNSYEKIIDRRKEIEPKDIPINNKYELLIYAAIRTRNKSLLLEYLDKKISRPVMLISQSEYLKPDDKEINEVDFLQRIKTHAQNGDFIAIEKEIEFVASSN